MYVKPPFSLFLYAICIQHMGRAKSSEESDALRFGQAGERELAKTGLGIRLGGTTAQEEDEMKNDQDRLMIGQTITVSRAAVQELAQRFHVRGLVLFGSAAVRAR